MGLCVKRMKIGDEDEEEEEKEEEEEEEEKYEVTFERS